MEQQTLDYAPAFWITCPLSYSAHYSQLKGFYTVGRRFNMGQSVFEQDPTGFLEAASTARKLSLSQIYSSISPRFFSKQLCVRARLCSCCHRWRSLSIPCVKIVKEEGHFWAGIERLSSLSLWTVRRLTIQWFLWQLMVEWISND